MKIQSTNQQIRSSRIVSLPIVGFGKYPTHTLYIYVYLSGLFIVYVRKELIELN